MIGIAGLPESYLIICKQLSKINALTKTRIYILETNQILLQIKRYGYHTYLGRIYITFTPI